jgi:hypothetical protein
MYTTRSPVNMHTAKRTDSRTRPKGASLDVSVCIPENHAGHVVSLMYAMDHPGLRLMREVLAQGS